MKILIDTAKKSGKDVSSLKHGLVSGAALPKSLRSACICARVIFDEKGHEPLLTELHQRIHDVRASPDGLLYALTDEDRGALIRIEPANAAK